MKTFIVTLVGIFPGMIALILGLSIAGLIFLFSAASGLIWRRDNPLTALFARCCGESIRWIFGICMLIRMRRHDAISVRRKMVVVANHGSSIGIFLQYLWMIRSIAPRPVITLKAEHRGNLLGKAVEGARVGIFLDRRKESRDMNMAAIRSGVEHMLRPGSFICIFSDSRRPTQERIAADRKKYEAPWLRYTKFPKIGGLQAIIDAIDEPVEVVVLTAAFDRKDERWWHIFGLFGATFHVKASVDVFHPHQVERNKQRLVEIWHGMQEDIARWKGEAGGDA